MTSQVDDADEHPTASGEPSEGEVADTEPAGSDDVWRVHLSGGGVRATLCSLGALWQFRQLRPNSEISDVISVSGGSLASVALLRDQPAVDEMDTHVRGVFDRVRLNVANLASVVALATTVLIVAGATFAKSSWLSDGWSSWLFTGLLAIWFVAVAYVRIVLVSSIMVAIALGSIEFDLAPKVEGQVAAAGLVVAGCVVGVIALVRYVLDYGRWADLDPRPARPPRRDLTIVQMAGVGVGVAGIAGLLYLLLRHPFSFVVHPVLAVGGVGAVSLVLGPLLLRSYLGRLVGDAWATEKLLTLRTRRTERPWAARHVVCTTSLRDEVPAFFVIDVPRVAGEQVMPPALVVDQVSDGAPRLAMDAEAVQVVTALQATSAAFPQFAPTIAFGTRTWIQTGRSTRPHPGRAPKVPLFADGGLRGTLGTQYTWAVETNLDEIVENARPRPRHRSTLVVDATRRRAQVFFWPVLLLPKYGSSLIQLRLVQAMLSALVDGERAELRRRHRPDRPVIVARATGAKFGDSDDPNCIDTPEAFREAMRVLRRAVDRQTGWFPSRAKAARCVAGGALAVIDAMVPGPEKLEQARTTIRRLEDVLDVHLPLHGILHMSLPEDAGGPARVAAADDVLNKPLRELVGIFVKNRWRPPRPRIALARWLVAPPPDRNARRRRVNNLIRWTAVPLVVALLFVANASDDRVVAGCDPVCQDGERNDVFAPGFVAVSHQGVGGASNVITVEGFREAHALGFRHFETDIGLATDADGGQRLVAIHKDATPTREDAAAAPDIAALLSDEALDDSVWHLELNSADETTIDVLTATISSIEPKPKVCIHFGSIVDLDDVRSVRASLAPDTCVCASVVERLRTIDLPIVRFVIQALSGDERTHVDCSVVFEGSADRRDVTEAGDGVVVMAWANGARTETGERLKRLVCDGFGGIITNDAAMLRDILIDTGVWDANGNPTGEEPKGCLGST